MESVPCITIVLHPGEESTLDSSFDLALFEGTEPSALQQAVASRSALEVGDFYLAVGPNPSDMVVPLTAKLPNGTKLYLHENTTKDETTKAKMVKVVDGNKGSSIVANEKEGKGKEQNLPPNVEPPSDRNENSEDPHDAENPKKRGWYAKLEDKFTRDLYNPFITTFSGVTDSSQQTKLYSNVFYFNQLGSNLANERTFLAWTRTMLACVRTVFSYQKLQTDDAVRDKSLVATVMMTATMLLMAGFLAGQRYYKTQQMLSASLEDRSQTYNMLSLSPFVLLGFVTALMTSIATYTDNWWD